MSKSLTEVMGNSVSSFFKSAEVQNNVSRIACRCFKAMGGGSGGLSQVYTSDSSSVSFTGSGTQADPLTAQAIVPTVNTLYTANGTITGTRTVGMPSTSLTFASTTQTQFVLDLKSTSLASDVLFRATTSGGSNINLSATSGSNYLNIGSTGTKLGSPVSSIDLAFSGGVKLLRGDDNTENYSRFLMAPGTSSPPSWNDVSSTGGSVITVQAPSSNSTDGVSVASSLNSNGYIMSERVAPQRFYINKNILSPSSNIKLFEVNQDGSIYFPSILNAPSLTTDGTGKLVAGSVKADINSPSFTGNPTAPTFPSSTNNSQLATTAFVHSLLATKGVVTITADGGTTVFPIAHGLGIKPISVNLLAANAAASALNYFVDEASNDTTNFVIAFQSAPPAGTLMFYWQAFKA